MVLCPRLLGFAWYKALVVFKSVLSGTGITTLVFLDEDFSRDEDGDSQQKLPCAGGWGGRQIQREALEEVKVGRMYSCSPNLDRGGPADWNRGGQASSIDRQAFQHT